MSAELIECFNNTYRMALEDNRLKTDTSISVKNTVVYKENHKARLVNRADFNAGINVFVEETTSFVAARRYSGEVSKGVANKVAVLNFANPHVPGGGVTRGAKAQEESLCRSSNLYPCLISKQVSHRYYEYNKMKDRFFSDRIVYSPGIIIYKDDANVPHLMPESLWTKVDIITCAAPFLENPKSIASDVLQNVFVSRIRNIFEVAVDNEVNTLILGAFGCGAFNNPPQVVANAFKIVIDEYSAKMTPIQKVVFAIKRTVPDDDICENLGAFQQAFWGLSEEYNKLRHGGDLYVRISRKNSKPVDRLAPTEILFDTSKSSSNIAHDINKEKNEISFDANKIEILTVVSGDSTKLIFVSDNKKIGECITFLASGQPVEIYFNNYSLKSTFCYDESIVNERKLELPSGSNRGIYSNSDLFGTLVYISKGNYKFVLGEDSVEVRIIDKNMIIFYLMGTPIAKIVRKNIHSSERIIEDLPTAQNNFIMYIDKSCGRIAQILFGSFQMLRFDFAEDEF